MTTVATTAPSSVPYADFRVGLPIRVKQALALLDRSRVEAVLDVGCADGGFLSQFPAACTKVGVDLAPNRFRPADIHFVQTDVGHGGLPFVDNSFDAVYAGEIIEHVLDTEQFLRDIRRVLRPGGTVVLTTPNLCSLKNLYQWMRGRQLAWVDYKNDQLGHVRYFSPESLVQLISDTGFSVRRLCSSGFEIGAHVPSLAWLTGATQRLFSHSVRGNCLIVAAVKTGS
jgi:2-polyprenyl-3-methyl-5-hydroxy-6-metoxy-1,4-benzoquinol methylase